jgi:hypothetical protein
MQPSPPGWLTNSPPWKPAPSALRVPSLVSVPVASSARMPPELPFQGGALSEAPASTCTSVYSGTLTTCETLAA